MVTSYHTPVLFPLALRWFESMKPHTFFLLITKLVREPVSHAGFTEGEGLAGLEPDSPPLSGLTKPRPLPSEPRLLQLDFSGSLGSPCKRCWLPPGLLHPQDGGHLVLAT